jgi:hypothetical protein
MLERLKAGIEAETDSELVQMMTQVEGGLVKYDGGNLILTDDKAPVELLGMSAIDAIIRDEVEYYRAIYDEKGLQGVLEAF